MMFAASLLTLKLGGWLYFFRGLRVVIPGTSVNFGKGRVDMVGGSSIF